MAPTGYISVLEMRRLGLNDLRAVADDIFRRKEVRLAARREIERRARVYRRRRGKVGPSVPSMPSMPYEEASEFDEGVEEESDFGFDPSEYVSYGADSVEDGLGVDDFLEFVETYGVDENALVAAAAFSLPGVLAYYTGKAIDKQVKYDRRHLITAMPHMKASQLRAVASDPLRLGWVRDLAMAEIARRVARKQAGRPVAVRPLPPGGTFRAVRNVPATRVTAFIRKYKTPTKAIQAVVNRPAGPRVVRPAAIPATNAERRAIEHHATVREARKQAGLAVLPKWAVKQREARREAGLKVVPAAQRRAAMAKRGLLKGDEMGQADMLGALMGATTPTLGEAAMSHPWQALLVGTALFGVGALVGKERILDAGLSIGEAVSGKTHGAIRGYRQSRSAR